MKTWDIQNNGCGKNQSMEYDNPANGKEDQRKLIIILRYNSAFNQPLKNNKSLNRVKLIKTHKINISIKINNKNRLIHKNPIIVSLKVQNPINSWIEEFDKKMK